jgi:tetratricopeptide (TPR) repeat protein
MSARVACGALVVLTCASSCTFEQPTTKGAVIGGVAGAGLGAIIGSMTGSWAWGALIGAAGGALAGYVIANETSGSESAKATEASAAASASPAEREKAEEADRQFRLALNAKDAATSEHHLLKSIEAKPTPYAHNNLGIMYLANGDRSAAREQFQKSLALDPAYQPARRNLDQMDGKKS